MITWSDHILQGKRILITGASSGIGRSCSILCSQLGAEVIVCGRDKVRLAETLACLSGKDHIALSFELKTESEIDMNLSVLKGTKPISGFIHSAGIERTNPLKTIYMEEFSEMFAINVCSAVSITKFLMRPGMSDKNGLSIVLVSSVSGISGDRGKIEYSTTKSALIGLTKSLALELSKKKVRVNSICPGIVKSEMQDKMFETLPEVSVKSIIEGHLFGLIETEDVANIASYLVSDIASHVTGTNITIDSGYSIS